MSDARAVWQEIGRPEAAQPTPRQLLAFMRLCDDDDGLDLAAKMLRSADEAHRCWIEGHDGLLDELRHARQALAEANLVVDAVNTWLKGAES